MIVGKVDFPFLHEQSLTDYRKTLLDMEHFYFAPIQCDQDSQEDRKRYYALKYGRELIDKELADLAEKRKKLYEELSEKYGENGTDKDWFMTMDGSVYLVGK